MSSGSHQDAYDQGHVAGQIAQRLAEHDKHFQTINGSIEKNAAATEALSRNLHLQNLHVQRLADAAEASAATALATAKALKEAEDARRQNAEQAWTPVQRVLALLGGLAAVAVVISIIIAFPV